MPWLLVLPIAVAAQRNFEIKGTVEQPLAGSRVILTRYQGNSRIIDSTSLDSKGKFSFKGTAEEPLMATLRLKHGPYNQDVIEEVVFYAEPGVTTVRTKDSMYNAVISGSPSTDDFHRLGAKVKIAEVAYNQWLQDPANRNITREQRTDRYKLFRKERGEAFKQFAIENPDSKVSLDAIKEVAGPLTDISVAAPLFKGLSDRIKALPSGQAYAKLLLAKERVPIGALAPVFAQPDTLGRYFRFIDTRGHYVLLDFWASWCGPCRADNPNLLEAYEEYKGNNFLIVGVSIDEKRQDWLRAVREDKLPWLQLSDLKGFSANEAALLYGVKVIPQNYLIDPEGKIIATNLRGSKLKEKLAELFHSKNVQ